jgi:hypothetical protein
VKGPRLTSIGVGAECVNVAALDQQLNQRFASLPIARIGAGAQRVGIAALNQQLDRQLVQPEGGWRLNAPGVALKKL